MKRKTNRWGLVLLVALLAGSTGPSWAARTVKVKGPMANRRTLQECRSLLAHRVDLGALEGTPAERQATVAAALDPIPLDARLTFEDSEACTLARMTTDATWICDQLGGELRKPQRIETDAGVEGKATCLVKGDHGETYRFGISIGCSE